MTPLWILAQFLAPSLIPPNIPNAEAVKIVAPFFAPAPGNSLTIDSYDREHKLADPLSIRGFVTVTPPKDRCLIIKKNDELPDVKVCKKQQVTFSLRELDVGGRINWTVFTGMNDSGTSLTWPTPYRLAQVVPAGEFKNMLGEYVPVLSCKSWVAEDQRLIELTLASGPKWRIHFPDVDTLAPQPEESPNLFVRLGKAKAAEAARAEGSHDSPPAEGHASATPPPNSFFAKNKKEEEQVYPWNVNARGAFEMNSARLMTSDAPLGLSGKCRYKYSDAPQDETSGIIECFNLDSFDAVLTHLPCSGIFRPKESVKSAR
jgi:hypothetical protein